MNEWKTKEKKIFDCDSMTIWLEIETIEVLVLIFFCTREEQIFLSFLS